MNPNETCVCVVPEFITKFIEWVCKPPLPEYNNSITLYEHSLDVQFINETGKKDTTIPTSPIEFEGRECKSLGNMRIVSRKRAYDQDISLLMVFTDNVSFGDTHEFIDGFAYFGKNKFIISKCTIHRNLTVGEKTYEYLVKCVLK